MSEYTELVKRLRAWCIDWDGSQMVRGEPPRDGLHCDILLDAADALEAQAKRIEELEVVIEDMRRALALSPANAVAYIRGRLGVLAMLSAAPNAKE